MPYLIDGHNLIGQIPGIELDDPNDEAKLVQKLTGYAARTGKRCVVVFDNGIPGGASRMSTRMVEVVFASNPGTADKLMMSRIRKAQDPGQWTVVSGDRMILDAAKARKMKTITSAEFALLLRPPVKKKPVVEKEERSDVYVSPKEVEEWLDIFKKRKKE